MKLKELRNQTGLTQTEIAKKLNIATSTFNGYEKGTSNPDINMLIKLADFFNTSIDELVERETDCINLKFLSETKRDMIKQILALNENTADKMNAFLQGMLLAEKEREEIKKYIQDKRNNK